MCLMRQTVEFTQFIELFRKGVEPDQIVKQMNISHTRYSRLYEKTTRHEKDVRRLARRSIREKERRINNALVEQTLVHNRGQLLEEISILLSLNGVLTSMKSYEHCSNKELVKVKERLMRNRSDKYQLAEV